MRMGSAKLCRICSRYRRRRLRISGESLAHFRALADSEVQRRGDGAVALAGGMRAGAAPLCKVRRRRLARARSLDCGGRVTRSPMRTPPSEANLRHRKTCRGASKVTEVIV